MFHKVGESWRRGSLTLLAVLWLKQGIEVVHHKMLCRLYEDDGRNRKSKETTCKLEQGLYTMVSDLTLRDVVTKRGGKREHNVRTRECIVFDQWPLWQTK